MSTHNIGFNEDLTFIIFKLSSNIHLISSSVINMLSWLVIWYYMYVVYNFISNTVNQFVLRVILFS